MREEICLVFGFLFGWIGENFERKSPKKKTAEKNKKTKKKKIERTPRGRDGRFGFKLSRRLIYFVFVVKCK